MSTAGTDEPGPTAATAEPTLRVRGLVKRYPGTVALSGLDFEAFPGEVHALLGANGAGKSTLIKILAGLTGYDEGTIEVSGHPFSRHVSNGSIAFIHQDLGLIDELTVAENVAMVAGFGTRHGLLDRAMTEGSARAALQRIDAQLDPGQLLGELSRAEKSLVAIARALTTPKDLIFFDEPTASLHQQEVSRLFRAVELLRSKGAAVVYVTHRLDEVFRLATRVTVLRDGRRVLSRLTPETDPAELVATITDDRRPPARLARESAGPVALRARDVAVASGARVSLELRQGEVVGVAGLPGAGHSEIGRALCGILPVVSGTLELAGEAVTFRSPSDAIAAGIVFVTSNRETEGIAYDMTAQENLFLNPTAKGWATLHPRARGSERARAWQTLRRFDVRPPDPGRVVATLSGGNQQKVILARCLSLPSRVVVLEEPTMGVDVGGRADIFGIVREAARAGRAVLVISTDFEELAAICDRVLVFDRGAVLTEMVGSQITATSLTHAASGGAYV